MMPGSCDWGDCFGLPVAWRWDPDSRQWLPVCDLHAAWDGLAA
jgi:hypothetical protein